MNTRRRLGIALLVLAGLIVGASLVLWIIGTIDRPSSLMSGAGALALLGIVAVTRRENQE